MEARVPPGRPNSGRIVSEARLLARRLARGLVLVDAAAGTGCQVVASVTGARLAVLVVEDSVAGASDALRVYRLLRHFRIPFLVVYNKYRGGVGAERFSRLVGGGVRVAARIPYSECIVEAYREGGNPVEECAELREALGAVAEAVLGELGV